MELTIAVYSACIAAAITIFQFLLPNALALILTGALSDEESAVTWSVVSRFFLSSDWPLFLRSESATADGVSKRISLVVWMKPLTLLLIAVAAVVTPLGLYDEMVPTHSSEVVQFAYVADSGLFGAGTPARSNRGFHFSRTCDGYKCPGDADLGNVTLIEMYNYTTNATRGNSYYVLPEAINPELIDFYQSGSQNSSPSLSGYFDIQARQWTTLSIKQVEKNGSLLAPDFKYLSPVWMDNKIQLIEGLIVDTKSGGIGFRNHSIPFASSVYGMEWDEDILWMQPETTCVNTNISISFTGRLKGYETREGMLIDRGGFCNIQKVSPYYAGVNSTQDYVFANGQANAYLYERAYFLAWGTNSIIMQYLNITDPDMNRSRISSTLGQAFHVNGSYTHVYESMDDFFIMSRGQDIVYLPYMWNATTQKLDQNDNPLVPNPHNITRYQLINHQNYCKGASGGDKVNISTLDIGLGYIMGPGIFVNKSDPNNASSLETWERPYYACASATRTSIKTIRFRYNGTREPTLKNLEIKFIRDQVYRSEEEKPVWGFETPWINATTTWNLTMISPLWGLLKSITPDRGVSTIQSDRFYIPASFATTRLLNNWASSTIYQDYTPGTSGPAMVWTQLYTTPYPSDEYSRNAPQQKQFVRDMMANSTSTAKLLNLMWTDYAANALVGTRGIHQPRYISQGLERRDTDFASLPDGRYPVYFLERRVHYRWVYGIPAFICLGIIVGVVLFAFVSMVCGRGTIARLRWYMFNVSSGRLLASFVYPDEGSNKSADTKRWLENVGRRTVIVSDGATEARGVPTRVADKGSHYISIQQRDEIESESLGKEQSRVGH